jgi:predicted nucleic acid-binding protein
VSEKSKRISVPIEGVVADANVLLSAVVGKAALRVFSDFDIVLYVSKFDADEVTEYLPVLSAKYDLQVELVEMQWKLLPLTIHSLSDYQGRLPPAIDEMKNRDPEDAHALALARSLRQRSHWTTLNSRRKSSGRRSASFRGT